MDTLTHALQTWLAAHSYPYILATLVLASGVAYGVRGALYELFLSPLRSIPGPWYAAISDFWLITHILRARQCPAVEELFEEYGPVVRVGPNKVVFLDVQTLKNVYGTAGKFDKGPVYKAFLTNNNDHAMTILEHSAHAARKRISHPHYIPANLALFQPEMHDLTLEVVQRLDDIGGRLPVDCLALFRHLMVDINMVHEFGVKGDSLSRWALEQADPVSTAINDFPKRVVIRGATGRLFPLLSLVPQKRWQQLCDADRIMTEVVGNAVRKNKALIDAGEIGEEGKMSMAARMLQTRVPPNNELVPEKDIISEGMGHLIAGSDTTSTTLSYLCWELSRRADIAKQLQAELDAAMSDPRVIPDIRTLRRLPYLTAFVKEGLRVYTAAPSLLDRVVPPQGGPFAMLGHSIPPGTVVATQAWSLHRRPDVFPAPTAFEPDRWLRETDAMGVHMMPFGHGARVCQGQNLAQMMLRIAIAAVARNFDIVAPPQTNDETMAMKDSFNIFPAGHQCLLTFVLRKH